MKVNQRYTNSKGLLTGTGPKISSGVRREFCLIGGVLIVQEGFMCWAPASAKKLKMKQRIALTRRPQHPYAEMDLLHERVGSRPRGVKH